MVTASVASYSIYLCRLSSRVRVSADRTARYDTSRTVCRVRSSSFQAPQRTALGYSVLAQSGVVYGTPTSCKPSFGSCNTTRPDQTGLRLRTHMVFIVRSENRREDRGTVKLRFIQGVVGWRWGGDRCARDFADFLRRISHIALTIVPLPCARNYCTVDS